MEESTTAKGDEMPSGAVAAANKGKALPAAASTKSSAERATTAEAATDAAVTANAAVPSPATEAQPAMTEE